MKKKLTQLLKRFISPKSDTTKKIYVFTQDAQATSFMEWTWASNQREAYKNFQKYFNRENHSHFSLRFIRESFGCWELGKNI